MNLYYLKDFSKYFFWAALALLAAACSTSGSDDPDVVPADGDAVTLKVGTYNLWCSHSRSKFLSPPSQRYWAPSSGAILGIIKDMDCDIFAFQEIGDSIYGKKGDATSLRHLMDEDSLGYAWAIWSNVDGSRVSLTSGRLSYSPGICYKTSVMRLEDGGVFWLGGNPDKPEFSGFSPEHGDPKRACVWAKMRHIASERVFYFMSAHLDTQSFDGVSYPIVNIENCKNLMDYADRIIVPQGMPGIIAGDINAGPTSSGYVSYLSNNSGRVHSWRNAYVYALGMNALGPMTQETPATINSTYEATGTSRIDHIFVTGFSVDWYETMRTKYPTADGTLHYPSDHFPVVVTLTLS